MLDCEQNLLSVQLVQSLQRAGPLVLQAQLTPYNIQRVYLKGAQHQCPHQGVLQAVWTNQNREKHPASADFKGWTKAHWTIVDAWKKGKEGAVRSFLQRTPQGWSKQ